MKGRGENEGVVVFGPQGCNSEAAGSLGWLALVTNAAARAHRQRYAGSWGPFSRGLDQVGSAAPCGASSSSYMLLAMGAGDAGGVEGSLVGKTASGDRSESWRGQQDAPRRVLRIIMEVGMEVESCVPASPCARRTRETAKSPE